MSQSRALSNNQFLRATLIALAGFLASGILGFVRTWVLAGTFGTSGAYDAFVAAQRLPETIFVLVAGGALGSSFIPIYAKRREADEEEAWRLASAVMSLASIAAALLGILLALFAEPIMVYFLLRNGSGEQQILAANMMRMMMITPFIFSISGLIMGILQSHGLFFLPSMAISMNSIGIILGAWFLAPLLATVPYSPVETIALQATLPIDQVGGNSVYGLAYGAILSAVLHLLVQIPGLVQIKAKLRPLLNHRIEGVMQILKLMLPRVLGLAVVQLNFLIITPLATSMVEGSLVALNTAFILLFTIIGVIGQSVGTAVFPSLSALHAEGNMDGFKARLASAMRNALFLAIPATVGLILMGEPAVSLFEQGAWTSESTRATAWALSFYATGLAGFVLLEILARAFYALEDTWTPVLVGIGAMASNIALNYVFIQFIGDPKSLEHGAFAGLAFANASTSLVEALFLWWLMRRRIGSIQDGYMLDGIIKSTVAAVIMGIVLWLMYFLPVRGIGLALLGGIGGILVFFGVSFMLGLEEAKVVPAMLMRRFRR
jgi:putative peptidoglycan lipid II flippase